MRRIIRFRFTASGAACITWRSRSARTLSPISRVSWRGGTCSHVFCREHTSDSSIWTPLGETKHLMASIFEMAGRCGEASDCGRERTMLQDHNILWAAVALHHNYLRRINLLHVRYTSLNGGRWCVGWLLWVASS